MEKVTKNFSFIRGYVASEKRLFFSAFEDAAAESEVPNGVFFILKDGQAWDHRIVAWSGVGVSVSLGSSPAAFVLGREGEVLVGDPSGFREETIDDQGVNPGRRGPLREIRTIDNQVFAVGMGRQVYSRRGPNSWRLFENGLPENRPKGKVLGFNAITGVKLNNMYVVGWAGEIWYYNGQKWNAVESPTNVALFDAQVVNDNIVYACGQVGTILRGHKGEWAAVEYECAERPGEFRSMASFKGMLYLTDGDKLFVLNDQDVLEPVDFGLGDEVPSGHVHANRDMLLSVAPKDLFVTTDGKTWKQLPNT